MSGGSPPYRSAHDEISAGSTRLYRDFVYAHEKVSRWLGPAFDDISALSALAQRLQIGQHERAALAQVLDDLADEMGAPDAARSQCAVLRRADSVVVFTGQQTGLFTGPLYAIYKALTVERWASQLSQRLSVPVIPCYWLASDDHDFAEVDHVNVPCAGSLTTLRYAPTAPVAGAPVGRIVLDRGIESVLRQYADCVPPCEFAAAAFASVKSCYAAGNGFSSAFARLWYEMFPQSGLLFVAPHSPAFKRIAAPVLQKAITDNARLFTLYAETSKELEAAGYHAQVLKRRAQTFLFNERNQRCGIQRIGHLESRGAEQHKERIADCETYAWPGAEPVSGPRLCQAIAEAPEDFSANVLLRPVVQNVLFPTLGVVLGPAETAYHAQIGGLLDHFGAARPAIMPRTSVTLMEHDVIERVRRLGIELRGVSQNLDHEIARVLQTKFPQDLELTLAAAAGKVDAAFEAMRAPLTQFDPSLAIAVQTAALRAGRQMSGVARKARALHRRREKDTAAQIHNLALRLCPGGKSQERTFNIVYYWARHGPRFLDELYSHWPIGQRDHLIWELH